MNATAASSSSPLIRLWRSPLLYPLNDVEALDDVLAGLNALWSFRRLRARVVARRDETADTRTFVLRPNRHWPGHRAGQHVVIAVDIAGVRHHRSYSIASAPSRDGRIAITVKRQPDSKVSAWLHENLDVGAVLDISAPSGRFGLADEARAPLLLLSAGSGITPVMSMLRDLAARGEIDDVVFLHTCRSPADAIFADELRTLAQAFPGLDLQIHYSAESGRLDARELARRVPDHAQRRTLMCGPDAFADWVETCYADSGATERLSSENFRGVVARRAASTGAAAQVFCTSTEQTFAASPAQTLLIAAELAGLRPRHGCRAGLCRSCLCHKRSGVVENLITGQVSDEPDRWIQLCISAARSDLELDIQQTPLLPPGARP